MTLETFKEIILLIKEAEKKESLLYDLGVDIFELTNPYNSVITHFFKSYFSEDGEDIISWWLYENVKKEIYDSKSGKILYDLTDINELWKYVNDIRKKNINKKYKPKKKKEYSNDELKAIFKEFYK